jgi:hypothetical protein
MAINKTCFQQVSKEVVHALEKEEDFYKKQSDGICSAEKRLAGTERDNKH